MRCDVIAQRVGTVYEHAAKEAEVRYHCLLDCVRAFSDVVFALLTVLLTGSCCFAAASHRARTRVGVAV
jgi:hypothetical protein